MTDTLAPIPPGEVLLEEFLKPMGSARTGWQVTSPFR